MLKPIGLGALALMLAASPAGAQLRTASPDAVRSLLNQSGSIPAAEDRIRDALRERATEVRDAVRDRAGAIRETVNARRAEFQSAIEDRRESLKADFETRREQIQAQFQTRREEANRLFEARREEFKKEVEERREEMKTQMEERREELKKKLETVRDERKKEAVERIYENVTKLNVRMSEHFTEVLNKIAGVLVRIESRTDKAEANGRNASTVRSAIVAAEAAIAEARAAVAEQAGRIYDLDVVTEETLRSETGEVRTKLHDDLVSARAEVKAAHDAVRQAAVALAQIPGVDDLEAPSSTTTSTAQ